MANKQKLEVGDISVDYLQKNDVGHQMCDCLLKLIENKPDQPMLFLADYFDSCTDKSGKIANALRMLTYAQKSPSVFEANLLKAYDVLSMPRNSGSKKPGKPGLIGSVYESFLLSILSNHEEEIKASFLNHVLCRSNEVVPFDIFRYGVYASYYFNDYICESKALFGLLGNKQSSASCDKALCDVVLDSYKSALSNLADRGTAASQFLNAALQLGPRNLAFDLLHLKENKFNHQLNEKDFLIEMCEIFTKNLKIST